MQNSIPTTVQESFLNFKERLALAWRVLYAEKAIVVIGNEVAIVEMESTEALKKAKQLTRNLDLIVWQSVQEDIAIHNLVYRN